MPPLPVERGRAPGNRARSALAGHTRIPLPRAGRRGRALAGGVLAPPQLLHPPGALLHVLEGGHGAELEELQPLLVAGGAADEHTPAVAATRGALGVGASLVVEVAVGVR